MTEWKLDPVEPRALAASIVELEAWLETDGCEPLTPSEGESIHLVLHELKRLRALAGHPAGQQAELPPLPAFSHFLENSTHDMQRDAIRAYAKAYARLALAGHQSERPAPAGQAVDLESLPVVAYGWENTMLGKSGLMMVQLTPGVYPDVPTKLVRLDDVRAALAASQAERPAVKEGDRA